MNQPKNITVHIGPLLDALAAAGGMKKAATKWRVDTNSIEMLFENKLPRLDALHRICEGAKIKPSDIILAVGETYAATFDPQGKPQNRNVLPFRRKDEPVTKDAG